MKTHKLPNLPARKKNSRKGENGRLLIIGGSEQYIGAVALAGISALRSGCDWVTIATLEKVGWAVNCLSPDLVVEKLKGTRWKKEHVKILLQLSEQYDAILLGNGMGKNAQTIVPEFITHCRKPCVLDADALTCIQLQDVKLAILTPHKREFETLLKNSALTTKNFQRMLHSNVLILKGPIDTIYSETHTWKNATGNAGMTKAGTGDVLAGVCAGFVAQGSSLEDAARLGTYYAGVAGDVLLKRKKGFTFLASDLAEEIENRCHPLRPKKRLNTRKEKRDKRK